MVDKKRLLIFYDWFFPGFKAGGPIQSLTNLAVALIPEFDIYVITSCRDLSSSIPYPNVKVDSWNDVQLRENPNLIKVFYSDKKNLDKQKIAILINEITPSVVYLNGMFSYTFFLVPLIVLRKFDRAIKIVICPRGMLKKGALLGKAFKKKVYIKYLKFSGLLNTSYWHATSREELCDINNQFPSNKGIIIAGNIPRKPLSSFHPIAKQVGELKLVYLALINEHKNLLLLLQIIQEIKSGISLDIYGPVVDENYWRKCHRLIEEMPGKVQYKGPVEPRLIHDVLERNHAFILLTKGENFGHAIFESFGVGRPVITTHYTPWQALHENDAGWNVSLESRDDCINKIDKFMQMPQLEYNKFCLGAQTLANNYYNKLHTNTAYNKLFS
ncbi:glycosyltransferase [Segetibacter aerophilus]|uniref:Glycosyl transferase family 1 domain-containing protein n=1 Tax=Segetibacter aerophilus TaxID=670293 RepID=A0A512B6P8_9BACT|nr:glycosyltransferase [Segetibacter aerophilus]GEO07629.1 hypothetical protein SAE01_01250 [Segetibacter aerophilus]